MVKIMPIIGIILRKDISSEGHNISYIYDDIISSVIKSGGIPLGVPSNKIDLYLSICSGFILQGGNDILLEDIDIIKKLYELDIPLLGICLGMQEMGYAFNGYIYDIKNHKNNSLHEVIISKDSLLNKIMSCNKTMVNTRHKSAVMNTDLTISGISGDGIVEAIEDKNKRFFLGVQWHPENMTNIEMNSKKIFDYFINVCKKNKDYISRI